MEDDAAVESFGCDRVLVCDKSWPVDVLIVAEATKAGVDSIRAWSIQLE